MPVEGSSLKRGGGDLRLPAIHHPHPNFMFGGPQGGRPELPAIHQVLFGSATGSPDVRNLSSPRGGKGRSPQSGRGGAVRRVEASPASSSPKLNSGAVLAATRLPYLTPSPPRGGPHPSPPTKVQPLRYIEERGPKGISVHAVDGCEMRLGSTHVGRRKSEAKESKRNSVRSLQTSPRAEIVPLNPIHVDSSSHRRFYEPPPPPEAPLADVSNRIAIANCVVVQRNFVCLPGSDLLQANYVLLKCQLLQYDTDDIMATPETLAASVFPLEYVREFTAGTPKKGASLMSFSSADERDETMVVLRPQYITSTKDDFCATVRVEAKNTLASSGAASANDEAVARIVNRRLNTLEYVRYLQEEHQRHGNSFRPKDLIDCQREPNVRLVALYTVLLSNTADGKGASAREILSCGVELPRPPKKNKDADDNGIGRAHWDEWWCVAGNPDEQLTSSTTVDGTSNPRLSRHVVGSLSFAFHPPPSLGEGSNEEGSSSMSGLMDLSNSTKEGAGRLCINVVRSQAINDGPAEDDAEMDDADANSDADGVDSEEPTPFYLHILSVTVDRTLMEETIGSSDSYHAFRRSASLEASMSWRRETNASIRISVDPYVPGIPQSLLIPLEPLEGNNMGSRAVLVPEYVRRAEERYLASLSPTEERVSLTAAERATSAFADFMAAEHEKQQWKVPVQRSFGEIKISATLQMQGAGSGGDGGAVKRMQAPLMAQGVRFADMRASYKSMASYSQRLAVARGHPSDNTTSHIRQPTVRVSLLSLKHSFAEIDLATPKVAAITSKDRAELVLGGNIRQFARSDLLDTAR